ncbi:MAG: polyphosphate kinase 1 [Myxococcota bacterium]
MTHANRVVGSESEANLDEVQALDSELSLLEFNRRVLAQSTDATLPLLERLRFLAISTTNLDEFFEVRMPKAKEDVSKAKAHSMLGRAGSSPAERLQRIGAASAELFGRQYWAFHQVLKPMLEREGIVFRSPGTWSSSVTAWIDKYFRDELLPVLTPVGLFPGHGFPRPLNKTINVVCLLRGVDAFGRRCRLGLIQLPKSLPRLLRVPDSLAQYRDEFVFVSSIIQAHVGSLFPGMAVEGTYEFRVTCDTELALNTHEADDLVHVLEDQLAGRQLGAPVRLEIADECPGEVRRSLCAGLGLARADVYPFPAGVNLHGIGAVYESADRPDLRFSSFVPGTPSQLAGDPCMFERIKHGDVLIHHPYESFAPVVNLLRQAANDPNVLSIKQALYRCGASSPIVDALVDAARNGKEVTVVVELFARFDEAANIRLAERLRSAGAKVVFGVGGYKVHAKILLIVRREGTTLRYYSHLGTGNYHSGTAKAYTDISYITGSQEVGADVDQVFRQLTGFCKAPQLTKLLQAPFSLHQTLLTKLEEYSELARSGRSARVIARMNSLSEPAIIQALYDASQAGVSIDLIVRGICCLQPGVPGMSDSIRVRSIVGRFLEHTRAYYFATDDEDLMYIASADWRPRNFFHRVEVAFPILDPALRRRAVEETLLRYLEDTSQAWVLQRDGSYIRPSPTTPERVRSAQSVLLEKLARPTPRDYAGPAI